MLGHRAPAATLAAPDELGGPRSGGVREHGEMDMRSRCRAGAATPRGGMLFGRTLGSDLGRRRPTSPRRRRWPRAISGSGGRLGLPVATLMDLVTHAVVCRARWRSARRVPRRRVFEGASRESGTRERARATGRTRPPAVGSGRASGSTTRSAASCGRRSRRSGRSRAGRVAARARHHRAHVGGRRGAARRAPSHGPRPAQLAARAWARAEEEIAWLGDPRENLWVDLDEVEHGSPEARGPRRPRAARARRRRSGRRRAAHGRAPRVLLLLTQPQWAIFQVLRAGARCRPGLHRPRRRHATRRSRPGATTSGRTCGCQCRSVVASDVEPSPRPRLRAFRSCAAGRASRTRRTDYGWSSAGARPTSSACGSTALGPAGTRRTSLATPPRRSRSSATCSGLGRTSKSSPPAPVAAPRRQLPARGAPLHRAPHDGGRSRVRLDGNALLDVVASGYLDVAEEHRRARAALVRRVLPYFSDCVSGDEWVARADLLGDAVTTTCPPRRPSDPEASDVDAHRRAAVANPTRLVPWADCLVDEAERVGVAVVRVVKLVEEIASRGAGAFWVTTCAWCTQSWTRPSQRCPTAIDEAIRGQAAGFGVLGHEEIDVDGLVDVVAMLARAGARGLRPGARRTTTRCHVRQAAARP